MNTPPRILIVDDEPYNVDYLQQELSERGFELIAASNGKEALEKIRAESPDLVLLDIMMPVMDGFAALEQVKADAATRDIPVIVISASNDLKSVVKGIQNGAEDYLPKPFEPVILHARITASLERKRLRDQEQLYLQSLEKELEIARDIQAQFLPDELPQVPGWEIAAYFKAAKFVAGDYYDAFTLPDGNLVFMVGDVCGKGVGAALFMTLFRSLLRASSSNLLAEENAPGSIPPAERIKGAVSIANRYIASTHQKAVIFSTLFIALLDVKSGTLAYINAGNEPAIIIDKDGQVRDKLMTTGPVVGALPFTLHQVKEIHLNGDETILAFTDGIPDAQNAAGEFFGKDRLLTLLSQDDTPSGLLEKIVAALSAFISEADQFDDITLMAIKRNGA